MRARFISVDVRWWWFRWCYWAIVRPPRHCRLPICIYHRLVRRGGVEHGVHVLNTAPMSTTSAATDIIRRVTGVAIISFNKPYRATPSRKSCRQHKLLGQSTRRCCTVECRFYTTTQSTVVHGGLCLSDFIKSGKYGRWVLQGCAWFKLSEIFFKSACTIPT